MITLSHGKDGNGKSKLADFERALLKRDPVPNRSRQQALNLASGNEEDRQFTSEGRLTPFKNLTAEDFTRQTRVATAGRPR